MSFLTATQPELIHSSFSTGGSALTNSTTATCISPRGNLIPLPYLPPAFFSPAYGANRKLRIVARGVISSAASSPGTLTLAAYWATTDTATLGTSIAASGALTPATSLSSAIWEFDATITCAAPGPTPNLYAMGHFSIVPTAAAGADYGVGAVSAVTGLSTEAAYYIQIGATWGSASSSNSIQMYDQEIWGLN
jgi:hypothetical protein